MSVLPGQHCQFTSLDHQPTTLLPSSSTAARLMIRAASTAQNGNQVALANTTCTVASCNRTGEQHAISARKNDIENQVVPRWVATYNVGD